MIQISDYFLFLSVDIGFVVFPQSGWFFFLWQLSSPVLLNLTRVVWGQIIFLRVKVWLGFFQFSLTSAADATRRIHFRPSTFAQDIETNSHFLIVMSKDRAWLLLTYDCDSVLNQGQRAEENKDSAKNVAAFRVCYWGQPLQQRTTAHHLCWILNMHYCQVLLCIHSVCFYNIQHILFVIYY